MNVNIYPIPKGNHRHISYSNKCDEKYNVHNKSQNIYQLRELVGGDLINVNKLKKIVYKYSSNASICHTSRFVNRLVQGCFIAWQTKIVKKVDNNLNKMALCKYHLIYDSILRQVLKKENLYSKLSPFFIKLKFNDLYLKIHCDNLNVELYLDLSIETTSLVIPIKIIDILGLNKKIKIYITYVYDKADIKKMRFTNFFASFRLLSNSIGSIENDIYRRIIPMINYQLKPCLKKCKYSVDICDIEIIQKFALSSFKLKEDTPKGALCTSPYKTNLYLI